MEFWGEYFKKYLGRTALPLYLRIYQGIRDIAEGQDVQDGKKLPPIRNLAGELKINNGTVARAYRKLEEDGIAYSKTGSGTFLRRCTPAQVRLSYGSEGVHKYQENLGCLDRKGDFIDLAASTPTSDFFPVEGFKQAINQVLDRDGGKAFGYQEEKGFFPLRQRICQYVAELGIQAEPSDILITTGSQQGIDLIAKTLIEQQDVIYLERPTYNGAAAAFFSRGAILVDVPMDKEGMDPNILENMIRRKQPKFVYIMPDFQSPTGISYTLKRRQQILELAQRYDFLLVEDDYLGELSFDCSTPFSPLKSLDVDDRIIYIKSFSKLFMPGLRLGFMVLPPDVQEKIGTAKWYSDISTSGLTQRAFEVYIRNGNWKSHLDYLKKVYCVRHDAMADILSQYPECFEFSPPRGGLTFWVSIPRGQTSSEIATRALESQVRIIPGERFYINGRDNRNIRLGYAAADPKDIEDGIERLACLFN